MAKQRVVPRGPGASIAVGSHGADVKAWGNVVPYVAPGAAALLAWILALIQRAAFHDDPYVWYWAVFVFLLYSALTGWAWWASRARGPKVCWLLTGAVAAMSVWTLYLIGIPELTWRPHAVYWGIAVVSWACAVMYLANKGTGDGQNPLDGMGKAVGEIQSVTVDSVDIKAGQVVANFRTREGTPASAIQQDTDVLATLMPGVRPGGVRVLPSKDDARVGQLIVSPVDRLATPMPWSGPSILSGGTAADPVRLGIRAAGWSDVYISADPDTLRAAPVVAVVGMSGAGKSILLRIFTLEVMSRMDTEYWLGDARKFGQLPQWMKDGAARTASDPKSVARMLKDMRAEVRERSKLLGAHGCDVWTSACCWTKHGIRNRVIIVDEAAEVASDLDSVLTGLAESVRSTGQGLYLFFQRGTADRFPSSARANTNGRICLGVESEDDAVFGGLQDAVIDAGARPWLWGADQPGMHYNATPGVPDDQRAQECRTFDTRGRDQLMAEWAERYIEARASGTEVVPPPGPDEPASVEDDVDRELAEMVESDLEADTDQALADISASAAALLDPEDADDMQRIGDDSEVPTIPPPPGDEVIGLKPKCTPAAGRSVVRDYVTRLRAAGVREFQVSEHVEAIADATGFGSRWLYKVANELCENGDLGPAILRSEGDREPYTILGGDAA